MRFIWSTLVPISLSVLPLVLSLTIPDDVLSVCESPSVISETFVGQDQNVKVQALQCTNAIASRETALEKRQGNVTNVCGATCNTNCFVPSGGGPDPNECHVITDALLYDSQNIAPLFDINLNASVITMQYLSCESFFVNQAGIPLQYCRTDWASVLDFVAFNCQSTQNAHGGNCVASDQRWFIQVQHS